jgi:hypothetical protein
MEQSVERALRSKEAGSLNMIKISHNAYKNYIVDQPLTFKNGCTFITIKAKGTIKHLEEDKSMSYSEN